jgi:hypothetical protein
MESYSWQSYCSTEMGIAALHAALLGPMSLNKINDPEDQRKTLEIVQALVSHGAQVNLASGPCAISKNRGNVMMRY